MDGRGGCCIARYSGGGGYDMDKIDHIMLRFRPIAPKPASKGSDSGGSSTPESSNTYVKTGRGKRRYAKNNNNNNQNKSDKNGGGTKKCKYSRKTKSSSSERNVKAVSGGSGSGSSCEDNIVTLSLLPDSSERKEFSLARASENVQQRPVWWSFKNEEVQVQRHQQDGGVGRQDAAAVVMLPEPVRVMGTWVRVECITSTWVDLYGLGRTDQEKLINLEPDTCPSFVSDGLNGVQWTNRACREMVAAQGGGGGSEVVVWLVVKEGVKLPAMSCSGFTCSVRFVTCGKEKNSLTLPCDAWRMDCGGFAWRLDMNAALSLGR